MNANYHNALRDHGKTLVTHITMVNGSGQELDDRQAVTWVDDGDGVMRPDGDFTFEIAEGGEVRAWAGFSAGSGGTGYDGQNVDAEDYPNGGQYILKADQTAIRHQAPQG